MGSPEARVPSPSCWCWCWCLSFLYPGKACHNSNWCFDGPFIFQQEILRTGLTTQDARSRNHILSPHLHFHRKPKISICCLLPCKSCSEHLWSCLMIISIVKTSHRWGTLEIFRPTHEQNFTAFLRSHLRRMDWIKRWLLFKNERVTRFMNSCAVLPSLVAVVCCLSTLFPSKEHARNESRAEKISHPAIYFIRLNDTFWPSRAVKKTAHAPGRTETNVGYRGGPL